MCEQQEGIETAVFDYQRPSEKQLLERIHDLTELIKAMNQFCDEAFHGWPNEFVIDKAKLNLLQEIVSQEEV